MKKHLFLSAIFFLIATFSMSQETTLFEKQLFIVGEDTLPCRILTPVNFKMGKKYPLVIFLHGSGERGNDNEAQLKWGSDLFLDSANRINFPAIVVFPQCPKNDKWGEYNKNNPKDSTGYDFSTDAPMRKPLKLVSDFIDTLISAGQVDVKRIYIGGLSMGGFGTFELLWRRPGFFAAAIPICGAGNPEKTSNYKANFPMWIFHGEKDPVIPVANSRLIYETMKKTNNKVLYTEYPGIGHNSWVSAFAEPTLLPWLFKQKMPGKKK